MPASTDKPFGIRVELPAHDPMSAPHLLGEDWVSTRWFETADARDRAMMGMEVQPGNYRIGDRPSIRLSKIDPAS